MDRQRQWEFISSAEGALEQLCYQRALRCAGGRNGNCHTPENERRSIVRNAKPQALHPLRNQVTMMRHWRGLCGKGGKKTVPREVSTASSYGPTQDPKRSCAWLSLNRFGHVSPQTPLYSTLSTCTKFIADSFQRMPRIVFSCAWPRQEPSWHHRLWCSGQLMHACV